MSDLLMGNNPFSAIIAFFVVLIPLILVHELGHFLAAKAVGITVLEFGIGFPPHIVKLFTWGETEFTLNWIPLGGFVRPLGEDMIRPVDAETIEKDRAGLLARQDKEQNDVSDLNEPDFLRSEQIAADKPVVKNAKAVHEVRPLSRIFFMAAGAVANFILAFILFAIIALTGLPQTVGGSVYVANVSPNSEFADWGLRSFDVILDLNGEKFRDSQDFWAKLYSLEGQPVTLMVQSVETLGTEQGSSGETEAIQTLVTREVSFTPQFDTQQSTLGSYAQINGIVPDAPADVAGIEPGDIVIAFNGTPISGVDDFRERTRNNAGEAVEITLRRGEEAFDVSLTPRLNPPEGQGAIGIVITPIFEEVATGALYQEGLSQQTLVSQPLDQAISYGANRVVSVITMTVSIPSQLVSGAITPDEARPVSVVGMSQIGAAVIRTSIEQGRLAPILDFIAVISVALGFFNLLPIPALDGGRIVFVLLEMVRGRPIAPEREGLVHLVGLALLLSLSVLIILNDVVNPITDMLR